MKLPGWVHKTALIALLPTLYLAFLCCIGSGHNAREAAPEPTVVRARLVAEPSPEFKEIKLHITRVDMASGSAKDWQTLSLPDRTYDLQHFGGPQELAGEVRLDPADYRYLAITLDPDRTSVTLADGSSRPLVLPEPLRARIPVALAPVARGRRERDIVILVDAARSVQRSHECCGREPRFILRPALGAVDAGQAARVRGRILDAAGLPQKGVVVSAQSRQPADSERLRTVRTGPEGQFDLDWLDPARAAWHVVLAPEAPARAAQASAELPFGRGVRELSLGRLQVAPAPEPGTLAGTLHQPAAPAQHDEVEVFQLLQQGLGPERHLFLVRSLLAEPVADGQESRFELALPAGDYQIRSTRVTFAADGRAERQPGAFRPCTVHAQARTEMRL